MLKQLATDSVTFLDIFKNASVTDVQTKGMS